MKRYEYDDDIGWFGTVLKVLGTVLGIGFTLFILALLAKFVVDTWTGGCIG